ncbi:sensor domain-containing diguanylate cyclase [Parachitinimonas caeni]|uniref:diguanylate cyclase n=1 Tax=Parachitinimonas caeni TaxID=3031301 RepID=A0ABT7E031_9NEIS|nr:diguanylate cyclase [Parachitinimonas caeni]MDK2125653.1 diguanylate cyclase [Parachitinimonas caeni]
MSASLRDFIVDEVGVGLFAVDRQMNLLLWNRYMANHSGRTADQVLGHNLFEVFPELPRKWLEKKIQSVFILKNFAFTSWEQRPWLFQFDHNRPITGGIDYMQQNCTFMPMKGENGEVETVCVVLFDVTDAAIYQRMLKDAMRRVEEASNRDGLTGIFNRRYIEHALTTEIKRVKRYGGSLALTLFDLDHFKKVNDTYGHLGGDEVLKEVSQRVAANLRETDILGRYGGEEFMIIMPATDQEQAYQVAERLRELVAAEPVIFGEINIPATTSMGLTLQADHHESAADLIHEADLALYYSKRNGRNLVTCYDPAVHKEI